MPNFIHLPFKNSTKLQQITSNGKRYYSDGNIFYPSVTTVLSSIPNPGLEKWRDRVGRENADKICNDTSNRGNGLHSLIEKYLKNEVNFLLNLSKMPAGIRILFNNLRLYLNKINNIKCSETFLHSNKYKVAGTVDLISEFNYGIQGLNGNLTVIDFKSSIRKKKEEWIEDYYMQVFMYSLMYEELSGEKIDKIAIFIASEDTSTQIFQKLISERPKYLQKFLSILDKFYLDNPLKS